MEKLVICDNIILDENRDLWIEQCRAQQLVEQYGTPLYVTSERQIRENYRQIRDAFCAVYPKTLVMCAMKANNNMALRHILSDEGAGGEAFGPGELIALLESGADPRKCVLNGGYKEDYELILAVGRGVRINADSYKEVQDIERVASTLGKKADVRLRLRLQVPEFDEIPAQAGGRTISERFANSKFGLSPEQVLKCAEYIKGSEHMVLTGYSFHLGRQSLVTQHFAFVLREMANVAHMVYNELGIEARVLNIGGGIPSSSRDPEGHGTSGSVPQLSEYAAAMAGAIRKAVSEGKLTQEPVFELEPGRGVAGSAAVLLTKTMLYKENLGHRWMLVDCGGNQLSRIDSAHYAYRAVKATHSSEALACAPTVVDIVGNLCSADFLVRDVEIQDPGQGDLIAILDAGMYAETTASQFNGRPRPATVLVHGDKSDVIKRRETFRDVFATQCIPARIEQMCDGE